MVKGVMVFKAPMIRIRTKFCEGLRWSLFIQMLVGVVKRRLHGSGAIYAVAALYIFHRFGKCFHHYCSEEIDVWFSYASGVIYL